MLKTVFVWLFIAVPLASAIGLIGYRMRNVPKPDIARLRQEVKGPDAS